MTEDTVKRLVKLVNLIRVIKLGTSRVIVKGELVYVHFVQSTCIRALMLKLNSI